MEITLKFSIEKRLQFLAEMNGYICIVFVYVILMIILKSRAAFKAKSENFLPLLKSF